MINCVSYEISRGVSWPADQHSAAKISETIATQYLPFNFLLCTRCKSPLNETLAWYMGSFSLAVGPTQLGS